MRAPVSVPEVYLLAAGRIAVLELGHLDHAAVQTKLFLERPHTVWTLGVSPAIKNTFSGTCSVLLTYFLNMQLKSHMKGPSSVLGATETRARVWFLNRMC